MGSVQVPIVPFSIVVNGTDASGASFQRQFSRIFRAQTVGVAIDATRIPVLADSARQFTSVVTNLGSTSATFALSASASMGMVHDVSPESVSLTPGASTTASFYLDIPANAGEGERIDLRFTATDSTDSARYNTATSSLSVAFNDDVDGDGFPNAEDNCPQSPSARQMDSDGDGIGDDCDPTPGTPMSISDFLPKSGPAGTVVTLYGAGFGSTPSLNTVTIAGVPATVQSVTATELVLTVPTGATTAVIAVVSPYDNSSTGGPFVVESSAPVVSGFSPTIGAPGTAVTILGSRFDTVTSQNSVTLNLTGSSVTAATSTSLGATVPSGAASGRFTVTTSNGTAISPADFFVPPSPYGAGDVEVTARLAFGSATNVNIGSAQKVGLLVFDGVAGQRVGLKVVPGPISAVSLYRPNQTVLATHSTGILVTLMEPPLLPVTGTYQFMIDPINNGTGTTAVTLYDIPPDQTGTIVPDGQAESVTINDPGQNAVFSFSGTANQRVSLRVSPSSPLGTVSIRRPDGSTQGFVSSGVATGFMEPQVLATTGTYTIKVDPLGAATGTVSLELYDVPPDVTGTLTIGSSPSALTLDHGQKAFLTFSGTQGQQVTVRMTDNTIGSTTVTLKKPDGTQLTASTAIATNFNLATQTLPTTGTYTIVIDPTGSNAGTIKVAVSTP
jgi:hypothetical protein